MPMQGVSGKAVDGDFSPLAERHVRDLSLLVIGDHPDALGCQGGNLSTGPDQLARLDLPMTEDAVLRSGDGGVVQIELRHHESGASSFERRFVLSQLTIKHRERALRRACLRPILGKLCLELSMSGLELLARLDGRRSGFIESRLACKVPAVLIAPGA